MNNASAILRTLVIYSICVPLAIWVGFELTSLTDISSRSSFIEAGIFVMILCLPLLLRWHYILLVLTLNLSMTVFFLPGNPPLWLAALALSLGISVLQRCLNRGMRFIHAPQITAPLIFLAVVVLATAKLTGGIGLHSLGGDTLGGKKYFFVLGAILVFFALTAQRIPPHRAGFYMALFFLPQGLAIIGDLVAVLPSSFNFLFWFFPANGYILGEKQYDAAGFRFAGVGAIGTAVFMFMLARYGIRGIFLSGKLSRPIIFLTFCCFQLFGGFRSIFIGSFIIFCIQFYFEGLHRSKLLPRFVFAGMLAFALVLPFANKLPFAVQRTLSFLPLNIDAAAKAEALDSSEWRYKIWQGILPQVPGHLLLGKGYVLTQLDFEFVLNNAGAISGDQNPSAIAGDYHNGFLSVVMPFGIWGVIAVVWLWVVGVRTLYDNYRFGDESLRTCNTLLLTVFISQIFIFLFVFGALDSTFICFTSALGLSVSLNGGIRSSPAEPVKAVAPSISRPRLQAGFHR